MKTTPFFKCLNYHGINTGTTGSVIGAYDFASGSGNAVIYNLVYPTGLNFSGSNYYGPVFPIAQVGKVNALTGQLSGVNAYQIGYAISGDFGLALDFSYNACLRNNIGTGAYTLFSTASGASQPLNNTFYIGIDEANHLFLSTSGYYKTLYYELKPRNLAFLNLSNQNQIEFGVFDPFSNDIVSEKAFLTNTQKTSNTLYIGGLLGYSSTGMMGLTGLFGNLYNASLFNKSIGFDELSGCFECLFSSSTGTGQSIYTTVTIPSITGYTFSGVNEIYVSGYRATTGQALTANGQVINFVFPSGITGMRQSEEIAIVLTGTSSSAILVETPLIFPKSQEYLSYLTYDIQFNRPLDSGEVVEIYTYSGFNPNVNLDIENLEFPETSFVQLIGDGLAETRDVDYVVGGDNLISGFNENDRLTYDILTGSSIITVYSGLWSRSKVHMADGSYYPTAAQFDESTVSGKILLTGVTGSRIPLKSDLYLNGQKLASGVHYSFVDASQSGWYGSPVGLNVVVLNPTFLPDFDGQYLYEPVSGIPSGIVFIENSELAFLPNYGNQTRYYYELSGSGQVFTKITGVSEQVWLNGVRQKEDLDYVKNFTCMLTSGVLSEPDAPFIFYNNESTYFNIN